MPDRSDPPRGLTQSVLWLGAALDLTFALVMLYMPFQFQGDPFRFMYGYLRPLGALFFTAGVLLILHLAKIGMPAWVGRLGVALTCAGLVGWIGSVQLTATRVSVSLVAYVLLAVGLPLAAFRPRFDQLVFRSLYGVALFLSGVTILIARLRRPEIDLSMWVDLLFLVPGLLLLTMHRRFQANPRMAGIATLGAAAPLIWYTRVWLANTSNWLGAGITATLAAGALLGGLYLVRPWRLTLPMLRRRVLALGLGLALIPALVIGAVAVYQVQNFAFRQGGAQLMEELSRLERYVGRGGVDTSGFALSSPDISVQVTDPAILPTEWDRGARPDPFEALSPAGERLIVAYVRSPADGSVLIATMPAQVVYAPARQAAASILGGALLAGLAAALLSLVFGQRITRRLARLQDAVVEIGSSRFEAAAGLPTLGDDEISLLSGAIGHMTSALIQRDREREDQARRQEVIVSLGRQALMQTPVADLVGEVALQVRQALGAGWCCVLQRTSGDTPMRLAASSGSVPAGFARGNTEMAALIEGAVSQPITGEFEGFVVAGGGSLTEPSESDRLFLGTVANLVATAMDAHYRRQQAEAEHAVARLLSGAESLQEAAPLVLRDLVEALEWCTGIFWVVSDDGERLECLSTWSSDSVPDSRMAAASKVMSLRRGEGLPGTAWETGTTSWHYDLSEARGFMRWEAAAADGLTAGVCLPVTVGEEVLGLLEFYTRESPHVGASLQRALAAVGQQVGQFIRRDKAEVARERLLQAEHAARLRQDFLVQVAPHLSESLDPQELVDRIARLVVPALADCAVVYPSMEGLLPSIAHVDPALEQMARPVVQALKLTPPPSSGTAEVARRLTPFLVEEVTDELLDRLAHTEEMARITRAMGIRSYLIVPLIAKGRYLGALSLGLTTPGRRFGPEEQALASDLSSRIALALDNAMLHRAVQETLRALEESHARLDTLFAAAPVGVALLDREIRYVQVNEALAEMNGLSVEHHLGRHVTEVLPELGPLMEQLARGVLRSGVPRTNVEIGGHTPAAPGADRYWLTSIYPVRLGNGELVGIGAMLTEITERKRMEEALRESEALLSGKREVLEQIASGRPLGESLEAVARFVERRVPGGICKMVLTDDGPPPYVPPEHTRWTVPIPNLNGEVAGILTVESSAGRLPSETERRHMEVAAQMAGIAIARHRLEEGHVQKLHSALQYMAEGAVAVGEDRRLLFTNPAAVKLLGLEAGAETLPLWEIGLPEPLAQALDQATQPGATQPERLTFRLGSADLEAHVSPVYTDFGRYGAIAVLHDATARAQFRRLQESFVANVSHELRGPLASLSATLEALADGVIPESSRDQYLQSMLQEMGRLRRLSYEVVDLTRLDSGAVQFQREPIAVRPLLEAVAQKAAQRCAKAGLTLSIAAGELLCVADYDRVDQVLLNLLENAVEHTPPGGTIHLSAERAGQAIRFSVKDTGVGIASEHLPLIWERFYKVDQARTLRPGKGTGLGLAIVRKLVEGMGGEVSVESQPMQGSTFSFTLPAM